MSYSRTGEDLLSVDTQPISLSFLVSIPLSLPPFPFLLELGPNPGPWSCLGKYPTTELSPQHLGCRVLEFYLA